ncbi:hypothetical protein ACOMHN_053909 [Nucella lapillus]
MSADTTNTLNSTNWCGVYSTLIMAHADHLNHLNHNLNLNHTSPPLNLSNCSYPPRLPAAPKIVTWSLAFYTWSVPVVLCVGVLGNTLSLRVFLSPNMRKLSASTYLAALSTSDILALLFYVLMEWLRVFLLPNMRKLSASTYLAALSTWDILALLFHVLMERLRWGVPQFRNDHQQPAFLNTTGVCHVLVYFSYVTRFLSAWLIVVFTMERYIGVCHPLKRKDMCGCRHSAPKILGGLLTVAMLLMLFKPILTSSRQFQTANSQMERCLPDPDHRLLSFVLDTVYGLSITLLPFLLISILNALIIRKLLTRNRRHKKCQVVTEESIIRMEFTVILLVVSFVFIVLNLPYCILWCQRFFLANQDIHQLLRDNDYTGDRFDHYEGALMITRVIFYVNYCVNFFLYSVTGAYFRKELKILVFYRAARHAEYFSCSRHHGDSNSSPTTPQSWV